MLKARVVTALFLVAGFLAVLFLLPGVAAGAVFALVAALGAWEWAGLMKAAARGRLLFAGLVLFSCFVLWTGRETVFPLLWILSAIFWLTVVPLWLLRRWRPGGAGYVVGLILLVPTWAAIVDLHGRSPALLLTVMALVWVADIAAYATGRAFGRHKLAPAISPGKTWEGAAGGMLAVLLSGMAASIVLPVVQEIGQAALAGFLMLFTVLSIAGDLFESLIKRQTGMKDSSQLLPGHGGILDRIDSQTSTLPLVALSLYWMGR
jgi:phosphatidate cytidylyltransferase